jgi:hypothetical protein
MFSSRQIAVAVDQNALRLTGLAIVVYLIDTACKQVPRIGALQLALAQVDMLIGLHGIAVFKVTYKVLWLWLPAEHLWHAAF